MIEMLNEYDWRECFDFAGVDREDVAEVLRSEEGIPDEENWMIVCRMKDGQFAFIEGGCDYTGWDCRGSAQAYYASSEAELIRTQIPQGARRTLGYEKIPPSLLGNIDV